MIVTATPVTKKVGTRIHRHQSLIAISRLYLRKSPLERLRIEGSQTPWNASPKTNSRVDSNPGAPFVVSEGLVLWPHQLWNGLVNTQCDCANALKQRNSGKLSVSQIRRVEMVDQASVDFHSFDHVALWRHAWDYDMNSARMFFYFGRFSQKEGGDSLSLARARREAMELDRRVTIPALSRTTKHSPSASTMVTLAAVEICISSFFSK